VHSRIISVALQSSRFILLLAADGAEADACAADAVPVKASWLAAARHTAGMASFQANPLIFNMWVRTRISLGLADPSAGGKNPR